MTSIQTFSKVRSLDVTWYLTVSDLGLKFSQYMLNSHRCMNRGTKNDARRLF